MQVNASEAIFTHRIHEAAAAGFRYVELKFKDKEGLIDRTDEQILERFEQMQKLLDELGIKVWSIHLPYGDVEYSDIGSEIEENRQKSEEFFARVIRLVSFFGAKNLVTHSSKGTYAPDRGVNIAQARKSLATLAEVARQHGCRLCVENLIKSIGQSPEEIHKVVEGIPGLRFTFDVGHANIRCTYPETNCPDAVSFLRTYGEQLGTIHVHDNQGDHDTHSLAGDGSMGRWGELYRCLLETNRYRGVFMFEPNERQAAADVMQRAEMIEVAYEALYR